MDTKEKFLDPRKIILVNVPLSYNAEHIKDYVEGTLDIGVVEIKIYPFIPGRALVVLEEELTDFQGASEAFQSEQLEGQEILLLPTKRETAIFVSDIDMHILKKKFLLAYLEENFAEEVGVIKSSKCWPDYNVAVVHFNSKYKEVVDAILKQTDHIPLRSENYHITIEPFYSNFHKFIGKDLVNSLRIPRQKTDLRNLSKDEDQASLDGSSCSDSDTKLGSDSDSLSDDEDLDQLTSGTESSNSDDNVDTSLSEDQEDHESNNESDEEENSSESETDPSDDSSDTRKTNSRGSGTLRGNTSKQQGILNKNKGMKTNILDTKTSERRSNIFRGRGGFAMRNRGSKVKIGTAKKDVDNEIDERQSCKDSDLLKSKSCLNDERGNMKRNPDEVKKRSASQSSSTLTNDNTSANLPFSSLLQRRGSDIDMLNKTGRPGKFIWNNIEPNNSDLSISKSELSYQKPEPEKRAESSPLKKFQSFSTNTSSGDSYTIKKLGQKLTRNKKLTEIYSEDIAELEEDLKKLSEENARLKEKPKEFVTKFPMSSLQAKFLQPYFHTSQSECIVHYSSDEKAAVITGPENLAKEFQLILMKELRNIKEDTIKISKEMQSILIREKGKNFLMNLDLGGALCAVEDEVVNVTARGEQVLSKAVQMLNSHLDSEESSISDVDIPPEKFDLLKLKLEYELLVQVSLKDREIRVVGVKDDVLIAMRDVKDLFEEIGHYEKCFEVDESEAKFFHQCLEEKICSALKQVEIIEQLMTDTKILLKFKGPKNYVQEAYQSLQDLKSNVKTSKWNLKEDFLDHELYIIAKTHATDKRKLEFFDYKDKYLFTFHLPDDSSALSSHYSQTDSSEDVVKLSAPETDITVNMGSNSKLIVKSEGNITREKSDVLVSLLGPEHDMRKTAVGKAFLSVCPQHYKNLAECLDSNPDAKVLTVKNPGRLKCLAICHIVLTRWNNKESVNSESHLREVLKSVLSEARTLGAKSISFPVVGCGRAFRFPPSIVSKVFLESLRDEKVDTFLEKVIILASDEDLFDELTTDAPDFFKTKSITDQTEEDQDDEGSDDDESSSDEEVEEITYPIDIKNANKSQMIIFTLSKDVVDDLKEEKKKLIREQLLYEKTYEQDKLQRWASTSWGKIIKESVKNNVWVAQELNPDTKNVQFQLKGQKEGVLQVYNFIHQEFCELARSAPKKQLIAPKRGTIDYLKFAIETDERFPSYWNLCKNKKYLKKLKEGKALEPQEFNVLVDVDQETKDAITNLVLQTMEPGRIGHGADAQGIRYSTLQVTRVQRVENPELFDNYKIERDRLLKKMIQMGTVCQNIGQLAGSNGDVATAPYISQKIKDELFHEINEHYLFHGAKSEFIPTLVNSGLDPRVSNDMCMFGKGIYTAEKSTKADQYADARNQRFPNGTQLNMILTRLLLGNVFLCDGSHKSVQSKDSKKLSRPPCMHCQEDKCSCKNQTLYDSVMGDGHWIFREFVVYHRTQCYPEYVITYQRV
ncbi:uncharacterized protein LOC106066444 isoform X2 [Biomphalaria glabrata]|uniref:Poly [ADP-ribose] polymerase n=1 Tax=Biomphalaria glabrata TaxID=6526 RepID=A0A9W3B5M9_BIOGL|nr:uncharacterized protein LOC106066444 isoform X2 [Biomphalaria glabrata]XP_055894781.1 uncharacterized protein LOC106066444 isoform X2 [Biomphalaria glabrata]XP_055894782.1 uncharacterized protein LOC106066444 isoform X2 [Biomphalaria glabrata]XP_055894783.1 uncharacterized protein LOC106066444 isoform X2 [Biomphalaria glabrata]XP_055894784.1 uncharacterized protein LOC106066444 isoform X2 [Biomphalaria glabrata]XP_055894785.1 uncharacterized protein LOC106066444 isoform X2 [Biomphalaria gla